MITMLNAAIKIVLQSVMLSFPISKQMTVIRATDATFTASKKEENIFDDLNFFTSGFSNATNKKEGRKIPIVETTAPLHPFSWYPINVTEEKTGPGVICLLQ